MTPVTTHPNPSFAQLGVRDEIVRALAENGIEHPFAIQELTLPLALAGDDLIGQARTGGGPVYQASGYLFSRMIALEAKSPKGVMADLKSHPAIKMASSPLIAKKYRTDLVTRANMKSRGLGDLKRMLTMMTWLLNSINAPDAPSEKAEREAGLPWPGTNAT